ncbi:MAG: hypothetical protein LBH76_03265, partial [Propionibacteriaceae bacterium]|nr:hypothetical protein [Propionibacteriaceae bacterium]
MTPAPRPQAGLETTPGWPGARQSMPADDPYQAGHYPGQPIYPGVFYVESAVRWITGCAAAAGRPLVWRGLRQVRYTGQGRPGESYDIKLAKVADLPDETAIRAVCATPGGRQLCVLDLVFEPTASSRPDSGGLGPAPAALAEPAGRRLGPAEIERLLPHRGPMLLLEELILDPAATVAWGRHTVGPDEPGLALPPPPPAWPHGLAIELF